MRGPLHRPHGDGGTGRPVVKDQRESVSGPADPHIEAPPVRQPDMISSHVSILASRPGRIPSAPAAAPADRASSETRALVAVLAITLILAPWSRDPLRAYSAAA